MFSRLCTLDERDGYCIARCAADVAAMAFGNAFRAVLKSPSSVKITAVDAENCMVEASSFEWLVYHCALSLHGPDTLQPFALRFASAFLKGGDYEKIVIAATVLAWCSDAHIAHPKTPAFERIRRLAHALTAFELGGTMERQHIVSVLSGGEHALETPALFPPDTDPHAVLLSDEPWAERNRVALTWQAVKVVLKEPPKRRVAAKHAFSLPDPTYNNNQACLVLRAFQTLEGVAAESPYAFNVHDTVPFYLVDAVSDAWFV